MIDENKYKALCYDCVIEGFKGCLLFEEAEKIDESQTDIREYIDTMLCLEVTLEQKDADY